MNRPVRLLQIGVVLVVALALSACGATGKDSATAFHGEQRTVAQVVEQLQTDGGKRDAKAICTDLLTPALSKKIETASKTTCASVLHDALADADAFELQVKQVTITGANATAVVDSQAGKASRTDRLGLQKVAGAWRIASLGSAS